MTTADYQSIPEATAEPVPLLQARIAKKGNSSHLKNPYRDAHFIQQFRALRSEVYEDGGYGTSVTMPFDDEPATSSEASPDRFDRFVRSYRIPLADLPRHHRTPAQWRTVSPWLRAFYLHHALFHLGQVYTFTLNLSLEIEAKARQQASAAVWLQKRIALHLRKAFPDCSPVFWFALETTDRRRLHLHGELVTTDAELTRAALRRAGGEWETNRQHQSRTSADPDDGWVGYCLKFSVFHSSRSLVAPFRGFSGEHMAATRNLTQMARELYEADRVKVVSCSVPVNLKPQRES